MINEYDSDNVDVMASFNIQEISLLLDDQLKEGAEDRTNDLSSNLFQPYYSEFRKYLNTDIQDDDIMISVSTKFVGICKLFQHKIAEKFELDVNDEWMQENIKNMVASTAGLYNFFVLKLKDIIETVIYNFISKKQNRKVIVSAFEEYKTKKDASTILNKKIMSEDMAIIASNMFKIPSYVLSIMDNELFLEYLNLEDEDCKLIAGLFQSDKIAGSFINEMRQIISNNQALSTDISLDLISKIRGSL